MLLCKSWQGSIPVPSQMHCFKNPPPNLFVIVNLETTVGDLTDAEPIQAEMQVLVWMVGSMI